jgi:hypothetical protein
VIRVIAEDPMFEDVEAHLAKPEQVGFFLAEYESNTEAFVLKAWHPVLEGGYELQTPVHVALKDEARAEIIQWAWREQLSLVEIHSHGGYDPAEFSGSDRYGFDEWVPHLWWRLQGQPYAALVLSDGTFDGWAWIGDPRAPRQIDELVIGNETRVATGETLTSLERRRWEPRHA